MKVIDLLGVIVTTLVLLTACALLAGVGGCARQCPPPRVQLIDLAQWDYACPPPSTAHPLTHECIWPAGEGGAGP